MLKQYPIMNLKRILTLPLLLALSLGAGAQQAEVVRLFAENPDRASNNMHSYEFDPIVDTPAPKGFKPFYITHYGRHGSRYEQNSTFGRNAQSGFAYLEHQQIAARMAHRYPGIFKDKARQEVNCFSSTNFRCIVSMCNFTYGLKDVFPKIQFTFTSAERFMSYINPSLSIPRPGEAPRPRGGFPAGFVRPQEQPQGFKPFPGEPGYDFHRFLTPLFTDYDAAVKALGNPEPFVKAIFTTGGLCQLIDFLGIDIYRNYFTPEELAYFWADGNDNIYRMWGGSVEQGDVIRYAIRPLLMDFVQKADAALEPGRYAFFQVPMATNIQMVFYRNKKGEVLTKILYNEKEITIPGIEPVSGPYYSWPALRAHFFMLCEKAAEPWTRHR